MRLRDKIRLARFANRILDGLPDLETMKEKLASRKLWAVVVGSALAAFGSQLGIAPDLIQNIVPIVVAYIGGQSVVDALAALKK